MDSFVELEWTVEEDNCESDHFPFCVKLVTPLATGKSNIRYDTDKAGWKLFKILSIIRFNYRDIEDMDTVM